MKKYLSAGEVSLEEKSEIIKERNKKIKEGCYRVIDGGVTSFGDVWVIGDTLQIANNA